MELFLTTCGKDISVVGEEGGEKCGEEVGQGGGGLARDVLGGKGAWRHGLANEGMERWDDE